jgi:hypothetical protein
MPFETLNETAKRLFPYADVRGNGRHGVIFKCRRRWSVLLYTDAERRDQRLEQSCCGGCLYDHKAIEVF